MKPSWTVANPDRPAHGDSRRLCTCCTWEGSFGARLLGRRSGRLGSRSSKPPTAPLRHFTSFTGNRYEVARLKVGIFLLRNTYRRQAYDSTPKQNKVSKRNVISVKVVSMCSVFPRYAEVSLELLWRHTNLFEKPVCF